MGKTNNKVQLYPGYSAVGHFVKRRNFDWNCWYFLTLMRLIGLYPPAADASIAIQRIALIIRYSLWLLNVIINVAQILFFYEMDTSDLSTTEYWNTVIDYWNWTIHNVCIHSWIVFIGLRRNQWAKLTESLIKNDLRMQLSHLSIRFSKMKFVNMLGIFYILAAVWRQKTILVYSF